MGHVVGIVWRPGRAAVTQAPDFPIFRTTCAHALHRTRNIPVCGSSDAVLPLEEAEFEDWYRGPRCAVCCRMLRL
ncbi:MAG: hypothetical protein ACQSGP_25485 [Frankia sp.]